MIVVAGTFEFDAEHQDAIVAAAAVMRTATLQEEGCITYEFFRDLTADGRLAVIEEWESADHLAAHFETDHMAAWRAATAPANPTARNVTRYAVTSADKI